MTLSRRLRLDLEACANELTDHCRAQFEAGGHVAATELDGLMLLAETVAGALGQWRSLTANLELASRFDVSRAGSLVVESVFDEILFPEAWRVLAAAVALALSAE